MDILRSVSRMSLRKILTFLFAGGVLATIYWIGFERYLTNPSSYDQPKAASWKASVNADLNFTKYLHTPVVDLETDKNTTFGYSFKFNKSSSATNQSDTVTIRKLDPSISHSKSPPTTRKETVTSGTPNPSISHNRSTPATRKETVTSGTPNPSISHDKSPTTTRKETVTSGTPNPLIRHNKSPPTTRKETVTSWTLDPSISHKKSSPATRKEKVPLFITSRLPSKGRLGNQMFGYASILGISEAQGRKLLFQPDAGLLKTFKMHYVGYNGSYENWTTIKERNAVSFDPTLMRLPDENVKVYGYLQSFVYFSNITDLVRQEFTFRDEIANAAASIVSDVRAKYKSSLLVGVHVRRGDFLNYNSKQGYGVPQKSYFLKAFDRMRSNFPGRNVTFFVAYDDLAWCRDNLVGHDIVIMPPATASIHLAVLSSCDHVIISGGTFGWWGGWLAGGKVIYYKGYMDPGTVLGNLLTPETYYPRLWIGMDD